MPDAPAMPTYHDEVSALIAEARQAAMEPDLPLKVVNELLIKVGCDTEAMSSNYRYGDIERLFTPPAPERHATVSEALATASDVYGVRCAKTSKQMAILLYAMSRDENWRAVLTPRHDLYAFARNILTYLVDPRGGATGQEAVMGMASAWLRPGRAPFVRYDASDGRRRLQQDIACEMFGDHWWIFHSPEAGKAFDGDLIVKRRPEFLPGLVPHAMVETATSLPELD